MCFYLFLDLVFAIAADSKKEMSKRAGTEKAIKVIILSWLPCVTAPSYFANCHLQIIKSLMTKHGAVQAMVGCVREYVLQDAATKEREGLSHPQLNSMIKVDFDAFTEEKREREEKQRREAEAKAEAERKNSKWVLTKRESKFWIHVCLVFVQANHRHNQPETAPAKPENSGLSDELAKVTQMIVHVAKFFCFVSLQSIAFTLRSIASEPENRGAMVVSFFLPHYSPLNLFANPFRFSKEHSDCYCDYASTRKSRHNRMQSWPLLAFVRQHLSRSVTYAHPFVSCVTGITTNPHLFPQEGVTYSLVVPLLRLARKVQDH